MYPQKGTIAVGSDADFVIWEPCSEKIEARHQMQSVDYTPWEGVEVLGKAKMTILRGEVCMEKGCVVKKGTGKYIPRRVGWD